MKTKNLLIQTLLALIVLLQSTTLHSQCANCSANYPAGTFSTTSNTLTTVNTCIYGGEYAVYNVTAGETYTWTTCGDTDFDTQLTLWTGASCGTGFLAYNDDACGLQSTITWVATFTGTVNLLVSRYNCANQSTCMTVQWACTSCGAVPGCTNPAASNYNPAATIDDGSCVFPGVDYVHPTVGGAGEFVGACMVNDCGPFRYTDNGGLAANYSTNIGITGPPTHYGGIYRVFCPETAGMCMQATFNSFRTFNNRDYLQVKSGPTQNSPDFALNHAPTAWGGINGMWGNLNGVTPFSFTSTDASGCLTFRFHSDAASTHTGWDATLQCVPCAGGPSGTDNNDCQTLTALCAGTALPGNSSGPGLVSDGCVFGQCPAGGENFSNWYTFQAQTTGTLNITITPTTPSDDYDFAIYGPNVTCSTLGNPVRCSDAATTGATGMGGDVDLTEPAAGNGQLATMNVVAGQQYIMVVDEWTATGSGYTLTFGGTASLDCVVLPVELAEFNAEYVPSEDIVDIFWRTESERDNDRFEVERSTDGINWEIIHVVKGAGTTTYETQYYVADPNPFLGVNYYRLNQWDTDGNGKYSEVIAVNILDNVYDMLTVFPNPTKESVEVIFNSYSKEQVMMTLTNSSGKVIVNTPIDAVSGGNRFNLDLNGQSAGVYIVSIITRDKVYRERLIKE